MMDDYYFKLVCLDDNNPFGCPILATQCVETLEDVHNYVIEHIEEHAFKEPKWILTAIRKDHTIHYFTK